MLTLIVIAATVLVSWQAFEKPALLERLILWPPAIERKKQYDRLLTHGFVHADWQHLLFNMITLFFFGRAVEPLFAQILGPAGFVLFYLSAVVVAILPTYLRHRHDPRYRSLGASGAVSAVLYGIGYVAYSFWMDRNGGDNVNHSAHLSGAIYGVLFMLLMEPRVGAHFLNALMSPSFG